VCLFSANWDTGRDGSRDGRRDGSIGCGNELEGKLEGDRSKKGLRIVVQ
jgi:hypothetical protein